MGLVISFFGRVGALFCGASSTITGARSLGFYGASSVVTALSLASCGGGVPVERAAYYWKTSFGAADFRSFTGETAYPLVDDFGAKNLYVRMFDVGWDSLLSQPMPVASIQFDRNALAPMPEGFVPVVYIQNDVFFKNNIFDNKVLAEQLAQKIKETVFLFYVRHDFQKELEEGRKLAPNVDALRAVVESTFQKHIHEVQFDCDWSGSTRERYFELLAELRAHFAGCKLSATIRLDQFKNSKVTGVPPVDRGMLMCYNVGNLKKLDEQNSIFNPATVRRYLETDVPYPLPLDLALPLFDWGVCFDANGAFTGVVYQTEEMKGHFKKKDSESNLYVCVEEAQVGGKFFRVGDKIRLEAPSLEDMQSLAPLLKKAVMGARQAGDPTPIRLAIFDWDMAKWNHFGRNKIEALYRILD